MNKVLMISLAILTLASMITVQVFAQTGDIDAASVTVNQPFNIATITNGIIVIITAVPAILGTWLAVKARLTSIRHLLDAVDDALYDDKVTDEEYKKIHDSFAKLIRG